MTPGRPITEDDLHAYVDGALDPARGAEVQTYLARSPDVAHRVELYARQRADLRSALAPYAAEPVPPDLNLARWQERRGRLTLPHWRAVAASIAMLLIGGAGGWMAHGSQPAPVGGTAALAQEAAESYQVFSADQVRPVEIKANDRIALVNWLSERLRRPVSVPDLTAAGYRFMGGRLVATAHGPAGLLLYDDDHGMRMAMLVRPMTLDKDMPMTRHHNDGVDGYAWANKGLGIGLVGAADAAVLHPLADEARRQIANTL